MKVLVLGATGATGRLVVQQLIDRNIEAKIVVRSLDKVPLNVQKNNLVECVVGNIAEFDKDKNLNLVNNCCAVISCLGHNITLKGMLGKPRMLVTAAIENICTALTESKKEKAKVILMNTTANRNRKIPEAYTLKDIAVLLVLSLLLPPQKDNEKAARYLAEEIGNTNPNIEWTAVRPDTLINEDIVSKYQIFESIKQSPVFNPGKTSRINVSHFMAELLTDEELWERWKFKMPVIYNVES